jgi:hypothetical protein
VDVDLLAKLAGLAERLCFIPDGCLKVFGRPFLDARVFLECSTFSRMLDLFLDARLFLDAQISDARLSDA